jgi:hypothetical protein
MRIAVTPAPIQPPYQYNTLALLRVVFYVMVLMGSELTRSVVPARVAVPLPSAGTPG